MEPVSRFAPSIFVCIFAAASLGAPRPAASSSGAVNTPPAYVLNLNTELSEDENTAAVLGESLAGFLAEVVAGEFSGQYTDPAHVERYDFFFSGIPDGTSRRTDVEFQPPSVLKSYSFDERAYYVTVSFSATVAGTPSLLKIIELKALPAGSGYRFYCIFDEKTAGLETASVGDVTFHHFGDLDRAKAQAFVDFKDEFTRLTEAEPIALDYYKFPSLDSMLKAYGILFDAKKCNFLCHDLGITEDGGRLFVTGMDREDYIRDYLHGHLYYRVPDPENMYRAFREGMALHYGGSWGGVSLNEMKNRFRNELHTNADTDFLEMFRAGRKSSVQRHFSFYFMCGLFCEEIMRRGDFDEVMRMLYSGADGEHFFANLEETLAIDESNFHDEVVRLIGD